MGTTLTGETAVDEKTSTFRTGSIVAGSRTWALTQTGGDLTQIADPRH